MKPKHIAKRGDFFYYIEVWNTEKLRLSKINIVMDGEEIKPHYFRGSSRQIIEVKDIECAIFWKNKESAEHKIKSLNLFVESSKSRTFVIKELTREEFIKLIPDKPNPDKAGDVYSYTLPWRGNLELKEKELEYLEKLKNADKEPT